MSEISMYEAQKKKLQGLCDEHDLTYRFIKDAYPIQLIIKPIQGMDAQITMLEAVEDTGYISPEASMTWIFRDGVLETKVTGGTFTISKTLRTKIESVLAKMINYWQQYFFRDVMEKGALRTGLMPARPMPRRRLRTISAICRGMSSTMRTMPLRAQIWPRTRNWPKPPGLSGWRIKPLPRCCNGV